MTMPHLVPVADLYVNCSYPMRPDVLAASDTCQQSADSAVEMANGNLMFRCPRHLGLRKDHEVGRVVWEVRRPS